MKKASSFILCILFIFLGSCSLNNTYKDNHTLLEKNLDLWNSFRIDGMIMVNFEQYNIYKSIVISNNADSLTAIVFDSGIFGSTPSPVGRFTLKDSALLQLSFMEEDLGFGEITHSDLTIEKEPHIINEIIKTNKLVKDEHILNFDKNYQMNKISSSKNDWIIKIEYDLNSNPERITGYKEKSVVFQLEINNFIITNR